jgi:hypothetical protein
MVRASLRFGRRFTTTDLEKESVRLVADWWFDNFTFWVWEEDGAIRGFSAADPRDGSIFALFVHPLYEGGNQKVLAIRDTSLDTFAGSAKISNLIIEQLRQGKILIWGARACRD